MMTKSPTVVWIFAAALALGACGKAPVVEAPAPPTPPAAPVATNDEDEAARRAAEEAARRAAEAERLRAEITRRVLFDYDRFEIRPDQQPVMEAKVIALRAQPDLRLTIEGHADERGSIEYNLALGMRRANAARDFLSAYGLDGGRFEVVSFGEERPAVTGQGEAVWSENRRAEFVIGN